MSTVLLTGATSGLGRRLAFELARIGHTVVVHGRDAHRTARLAAEIDDAGGEAHAVVADLSSLAEVRALGIRVATAHPDLDVLVNNAGVGFGAPGEERAQSADGHELRLAVNYLAPVALTRALLPVLRKNAPARIVNVGSAGQVPIDFDDIEFTSGYVGVEAYRRSKFALVAYTFALAEELAGSGVSVNVLHPATYMDTELVRKSGFTPHSSVDEGMAAVLALAATDTGIHHNGAYFNGTRLTRAHPQTYDRDVRSKLLAVTDRLLAS
ncbi:SDR family NAD(P)-dependent oxidoreductase [Streptomyces sp. TS71-3]|uniref:SDR family NAD(P)-dependent oxidoreductase n=1 Tax=Streptomyces sp. TS71-3 TaxID=2733862 RepID=UPI001B0D2AE9|nr:SDR family NAD(P)-dependent oxidoreductase [Streptomyces sp. TS71-3]GHJ41810.1 3-oxoacyl-ACP reductase [Streptomyces sp. TS71-3]